MDSLSAGHLHRRCIEEKRPKGSKRSCIVKNKGRETKKNSVNKSISHFRFLITDNLAVIRYIGASSTQLFCLVLLENDVGTFNHNRENNQKIIMTNNFILSEDDATILANECPVLCDRAFWRNQFYIVHERDFHVVIIQNTVKPRNRDLKGTTNFIYCRQIFAIANTRLWSRHTFVVASLCRSVG